MKMFLNNGLQNEIFTNKGISHEDIICCCHQGSRKEIQVYVRKPTVHSLKQNITS